VRRDIISSELLAALHAPESKSSALRQKFAESHRDVSVVTRRAG
jgi:hypothetical protein